MPRLLPDRPYTCYFCATEYILHSYIEVVDLYERVGRTGPKNCPCCTAPTLLGVRPSAKSSAGGIVDLYFGLGPGEDTPQSYLERMYEKIEDVDACLAEVPRIDLEAMEADLRSEDLSDPDTRREVQAVLKALPQMRKGFADGTLLAALQQIAEAAKATIERRRAEWQRLYEQNCGGKTRT